MRIKYIYPLLLLLPVISACQGEDAPEAAQVPDAPKRVFTARASLPDSGETRSYVIYGNNDPTEEVFRWHKENVETKDCITVFNINRLSDYPKGIELDVKDIDGRYATFESLPTDKSEFEVNKGDVLFVSYWPTDRKMTDGEYDARNIFTLDFAYDKKPQIIVDNPYDASMSSMTWMQGSLKMYDIVTAVKDGEIPDIHFRHLSAIMRVTLWNQTGEALYPKELQFVYPETQSFFNGKLYCSVDPTASDGNGLKIWDTSEFYGESGAYTDVVTAAINNYTAAGGVVKGGPIANGEYYDLYMVAIPRFANTQKGNELKIRLQQRASSEGVGDVWYEMTLGNFDVPIRAGCRYWFNLTAVKGKDGVSKLMLTSDYPE